MNPLPDFVITCLILGVACGLTALVAWLYERAVTERRRQIMERIMGPDCELCGSTRNVLRRKNGSYLCRLCVDAFADLNAPTYSEWAARTAEPLEEFEKRNRIKR